MGRAEQHLAREGEKAGRVEREQLTEGGSVANLTSDDERLLIKLLRGDRHNSSFNSGRCGEGLNSSKQSQFNCAAGLTRPAGTIAVDTSIGIRQNKRALLRMQRPTSNSSNLLAVPASGMFARLGVAKSRPSHQQDRT